MDSTEELSLADISVVDELPTFDGGGRNSQTPHLGLGGGTPPIENPSSDDNLPTMRKRVAPRVAPRGRPAPPPPGPLASSRGRAAPPGPASEPFPLARGNRGAPLR